MIFGAAARHLRSCGGAPAFLYTPHGYTKRAQTRFRIVEAVEPHRRSGARRRAHGRGRPLLHRHPQSGSGDKERYAEYVKQCPGTYWYSPGWNKCHIPPGKDRYDKLYQQYVEKYGEDDAQYCGRGDAKDQTRKFSELVELFSRYGK